MKKGSEDAMVSTRRCLEALQKFVGKTITVERGRYTFCTEEGHPPHFWPPGYEGSFETLVISLTSILLDLPQLYGITTDGLEIAIPYSQDGGSSIGSYSTWYITAIRLEGRTLFKTAIEQDDREGFTGQFYFRLE